MKPLFKLEQIEKEYGKENVNQNNGCVFVYLKEDLIVFRPSDYNNEDLYEFAFKSSNEKLTRDVKKIL